MAPEAPIVRGLPDRKGKEPWPSRTVRVVGGKLPKHDQKHVVGDVFEIALANSQAPERVPNVVEILHENGAKVGSGGLQIFCGVAHVVGLGPGSSNRHRIRGRQFRDPGDRGGVRNALTSGLHKNVSGLRKQSQRRAKRQLDWKRHRSASASTEGEVQNFAASLDVIDARSPTVSVDFVIDSNASPQAIIQERPEGAERDRARPTV